MQDALTLSEETKTNLESELGMYETNVQDLSKTIKQNEEKMSQITEQKTKLVINDYFNIQKILEKKLYNFFFTGRGNSECNKHII